MSAQSLAMRSSAGLVLLALTLGGCGSNATGRLDDPDAIDRYGFAHGDTYAGSYERSGVRVTLWTRSPETRLRELRARTSTPIAAEQATYTLRSLKRVTRRIVEDADELVEDGVDVQGVGTDVETNRVFVFVGSPADAATAILRSRYGPAVTVEGQLEVGTG